jgi:hypothetical protein
MLMYLSRLAHSRCFLAGLLLFIGGCGPFIVFSIVTVLGFTDDPNPNPVGLGIIFGLFALPSLSLIALGLARARAGGGEWVTDMAIGRRQGDGETGARIGATRLEGLIIWICVAASLGVVALKWWLR